MARYVGLKRLCIVVVVLFTGSAVAQELVENGGFDSGADGWTNWMERQDIEGVTATWLRECGRDGSGGIHIHSEKGGPQANWIWAHKVTNIPRNKMFRITGWVKGKDVKTLAAICVQGRDKSGEKLVDFATTGAVKPMKGDFDWTQIDTRMRPSAETTQLIIMAFIHGKGEAWFDDISVVASDTIEGEDLTEREDQTTWGQVGNATFPGLFEARGRSTITAQRKSPNPTILFPLPISYREQVPLTYELYTEPAEKLASVRVYRDRPNNYVAEAVLKPLKRGEKVILSWRSIVLSGERSFDDVPKLAPMPKMWPKKTRRWLKSTQCVQAKDERIRKIASEIRGNSDDVMEIVHATLSRAGEIIANQEGRGADLGAIEALEKQGSCTSAANLVAALLRANDIPARILAGYATWFGPHQTHYIVEAYVPEYGWYPIESTKLVAPWQPYKQIEVSMIRPDYEDRSGGRPFAAAGVPFLSLTEYPTHDGSFISVGMIDDDSLYCDHVAKLWRKFPTKDNAADWRHTIKRAKVRWKTWLKSSPSVNGQHRLETPLSPDAIKANNPRELAKALGE